MTEAVVRKLIEAFKLDVSVEEACLYARISKDTYYRKLKEDEDFSDEIASAQMYATMAAGLSVIKAIPNDPHLALRYLERKRREEFSTQQSVQPQQEQKINLGMAGLALLAKYQIDPRQTEVSRS